MKVLMARIKQLVACCLQLFTLTSRSGVFGVIYFFYSFLPILRMFLDLQKYGEDAARIYHSGTYKDIQNSSQSVKDC